MGIDKVEVVGVLSWVNAIEVIGWSTCNFDVVRKSLYVHGDVIYGVWNSGKTEKCAED